MQTNLISKLQEQHTLHIQIDINLAIRSTYNKNCLRSKLNNKKKKKMINRMIKFSFDSVDHLKENLQR